MSLSKQVLVTYLERKKVLKIPLEKQESDIIFLTKEFRKEFKLECGEFDMSFQLFSAIFGEYVELEDEILDKDKLKAIVQPQLLLGLLL